MEQSLNAISKLPCIKKYNISDDNIFYELHEKFFKRNLFNSFDFSDIVETINFIYESYGKFIYVKIIDNKVKDFIKFKSTDYHNLWQKNSKKYKGYINFQQDQQDKKEDLFLDGFVVEDFDHDQDVSWLKTILDILCEFRVVPDVEFIINAYRNTPIVTVDRTISDASEKYILDFNAPLKQHNVLSFNTSSRFKDIPIPNFADFERSIKNLFGIENFKSMYWQDKLVKFVYRGDSINPGVSKKYYPINQKYALVDFMNKNYPEISDVGITNIYYETPLVLNNKIYFAENDETLLSSQPIELFSKNKFIFAVDGIGTPEELSMILFSGSCILRVESYGESWNNWYDSMIQPGIHYILIKSDLSDLNEKIQWCLQHDEECREIGINARNFATRYLSKNGILDYYQMIFTNYINRVKYDVSFSRIQAEWQKNTIDEYLNTYDDLPFEGTIIFNELNKYTRNWEWNTTLSILIYKSFDLQPLSDFFLIKRYQNIYDAVNDAFIGMTVINDLIKEIPNFCFTLSIRSDENNTIVFRENIQNIEFLDDFLNKNPKSYTEIMIQLCLALQLAYERFYFQHGDLTPKKIFVQTLSKPRKIIYRLLSKSWAIDTRYIVIITDYSKSKILSNFSTTVYKKNKFFIGRLNNDDNHSIKISDIEDLMKISVEKDIKKLFSEIDHNYDIKGKDPENILKSLIKKEDIKKYKIKFGIVNEMNTDLEKYNPRLIYDIITGETKAYHRVTERILKNGIPRENSCIGNIVLQYEILQTIEAAKNNENNENNDVEELDKSICLIKSTYDKIINKNSETYDDEILNIYDNKIFLRRYAKQLLENNNNKKILTDFFNINQDILQSYIKQCKLNTFSFYEKYITNENS